MLSTKQKLAVSQLLLALLLFAIAWFLVPPSMAFFALIFMIIMAGINAALIPLLFKAKGQDFIANIAHELRSPITILRGFAETLQDNPDLPKEQFIQITSKLVRTCLRMDKLARGLILLSDMEHIAPKRFQEVDLVALTAQCIEQLLAIHPKARARLSTNLTTAPVAAEKDLLEIAIMNLLENGVKYSTSDADIEVKIEKIGHALHCSISDRGIGISPSDLPHIFDRFYAADKPQSRKAGGAGLGLSIVKTIVEKHEGTIIASSILGKGSTFTVVLPQIH